MPVVVKEAMAMEVPVVATSVGGPAELISHGKEGLLLPPREPARWAGVLESLITDPALRKSMGTAGRKRAMAELATERHVDGVMSVYRKVMAVSATGRSREGAQAGDAGSSTTRGG